MRSVQGRGLLHARGILAACPAGLGYGGLSPSTVHLWAHGCAGGVGRVRAPGHVPRARVARRHVASSRMLGFAGAWPCGTHHDEGSSRDRIPLRAHGVHDVCLAGSVAVACVAQGFCDVRGIALACLHWAGCRLLRCRCVGWGGVGTGELTARPLRQLLLVASSATASCWVCPCIGHVWR